MQRFVIFGIFAIGFNILFGLTGYLSPSDTPPSSGVGSYAAIWMMKLLTMNVIPAIIIAVIVAGCSRCGRLDLAAPFGHLLLDPDAGLRADVLALAYSVLTPITGGETGLQPKSAIRGSFDPPCRWRTRSPTCSG
jgi:hypothetical protein